jgi:hypothetical protein
MSFPCRTERHALIRLIRVSVMAVPTTRAGLPHFPLPLRPHARSLLRLITLSTALIFADSIGLGAPAAPLVDAAVGDIRLVVAGTDAGGVGETYFAREANGAWTEIASGFLPIFTGAEAENRFFDTRVTPHRYSCEEILSDRQVEQTKDGDKVIVRIRGARAGRIALTKTITLHRGSPWAEVEIEATLAEPQLDYLRSSVTFVPGGPLDFVHSPTTKQEDRFNSGPARDQVIGDHAFHSPAVILQKGTLAIALIPRLDLINAKKVLSADARSVQRVPRGKFSVPLEPENNSMPTALDLTVRSGLTDRPVLSYGVMDFIVSHHIRYQRINDATMIRHLAGRSLHFGYSLLVTARARPQRAYQEVSRQLWKRYGTHEFSNATSPQLAMPVREYVRLIYHTVSKPMDPKIQAPVPGFADHGVFLDFERDGVALGGMVTPLGHLGFGDALWSFEFWNNVRDAAGMRFWGRELGMPELVGRARRIVNLALAAPQNESGFFPLVYHASSRRWQSSSIGREPNPRFPHPWTIFAHKDTVYSVPAMSKTAAHLADYFADAEAEPRILPFLIRYADGLLKLLPPDGAMPDYFDEGMQPVPVLGRTAQPAATLWFLARMAKLTGQAEYLAAAKRIAAYLEREILPQQRWIDLEPYFSCGRNSLEHTQDLEQGLPVRGNLSMIWAAEGFLALHDVTADAADLARGEAVVDYLAFAQASWRPHYVYTANPFGGCTADNIDTATWLDARHCELVHPFLEYGLRLGRSDLLERGVAAARAGVALINHPRHKANGIYRHPNLYGTGLGPENINHEGHNQSAMRTHPSWGECSAIFTGLATATRILGGGYIEPGRGLAVPVEPVLLPVSPTAGGRTMTVTAASALRQLPVPWTETFTATFTINQEGRLVRRPLAIGESAVLITPRSH